MLIEMKSPELGPDAYPMKLDRRPPPEIIFALQALAARGSSQTETWVEFFTMLDKTIVAEREQVLKASEATSIEDALGIEFTAEEPDTD